MKKLITTIALVSMMGFPSSALSVMVNGTLLQSDVAPQIVNDRTMLPARAIAESLQSKVDWNEKTSTATITNATTKIEIQINNKMAKVNGNYVELDVPAMIVNGRTMLPASFVANSMGWEVNWDASTKTVNIKSAEGSKEGESNTEEIQIEERKTEEMRREELKMKEAQKEQEKKKQEKKEQEKKEQEKKEGEESQKPRLAPLPSPKIDIGN